MKRSPCWGLPAKLILLYSSIWLLAAWPAAAFIGTAYQMQLGNPSNAAADPANHQHYLLQRSVQAIDYNDSLGVPNWVSWDLTADDIGDAGRSSSFYTDPDLPAGFYRVSEGDYSGSGYTRGHMCPSMDRTATSADNKLVFYMSNIIPQTGDNNGGVWSGLETYCQTLAKAGNELLIICGPSGFDGSRLSSSDKVAIPAYTWKIVVVVPPGAGTALSRITTATRVIAIKIPNINGIAGIPWTSYVTSVNQLQADTGFTFLTAVPAPVATVLRGLVDGTPAPAVLALSPLQGAVGIPVVITGTNLLGASAVSFQGVSASFTVDSNTRITALVPPGAITGPIGVTTPGGLTVSATSFGITSSDQVGILVQPLTQEADLGSNVVFTVQATGAPPLAYQWWKDGAILSEGDKLSGTTSNWLALAEVGPAQAGAYTVVVSNFTGSVTSTVALLTINAHTNPPTILAQPANLTVVTGQDAPFQVTVAGTLPLVYQWQFNGEPIPGATQSSYSRLQAQATDAGLYSVLVSNDFGAVTSTSASLTVQAPGLLNLIAQWSFNNTNTSLTSPLPTTGSGTATLVGGATPAYAGGSALDTTPGNNNAWNTTTYPAQGTANKSRGVQFNLSTRGYRNLVVSWEQRLSNTASKYYRLQFSTNGTDFIDGPVVTMTAAGSFESKTNRLFGLPGVDDNPNFAFRIVAEFESTAASSANANYATASTSTYGTGGTVRFDLVTVSASAIPAASTLQVLDHGAGWLQLSATGATGARHVLQYSTDLAVWTPVLTNALPFTFTDTNTAGAARFFRAVAEP